MTLNRRGFFSAISTAIAGPTATQAVATQERLPVQAPALTRAVLTLPEDFRIPGWHIWWTGWKTHYCQSALCGQWLASPVQRDNSLVPGMPSIYSAVPGSCAAYRQGDVFDVCYRFGQPPTDETSTDELRELGRRNALALLLDVLRNAQHWMHEPSPWGSPPNVKSAWVHLKPASQFLLDDWRYTNERYPGFDWYSDTVREALAAERKRLLGF
jgi:hypothetical protein